MIDELDMSKVQNMLYDGEGREVVSLSLSVDKKHLKQHL